MQVLGLHSKRDNKWKGVVEKLFRDVAKTDSRFDIICQTLSGKKRIARLAVYAEVVADQQFLIAHIVGLNDRGLQEAGQKWGYPRGFAIPLRVLKNGDSGDVETVDVIRDANGEIVFAGFLPKFKNDDRQVDQPLDTFLKGTSLRITLKFSGSLGMMTAFEVDGEKYLLVSAKNSSGNIYTEEEHRLLMEWVQERPAGGEMRFNNWINASIQNRLVTCFEICSSRNAVAADGQLEAVIGHHGATYKRDRLVTLAIGSTRRELVDDGGAFIHWFPNGESGQKMIEYDLPHGPQWIFEIDRDDSGVVGNALQRIITERDRMTYSRFAEIMQDAVEADSNIDMIHGNVDHAEMTDVLEGIVVFLDNRPFKFKFANYTIRTMLIRTALCEMGAVVPGKTINWFKVHSMIQQYLNWWVVHSANRPYFDRLACWVFQNISQSTDTTRFTHSNYLFRVEPLIHQFEKLDGDDGDDCGGENDDCNEVLSLTSAEYLEKFSNDVEEISQIVPVFLIFGAPCQGSGKTTLTFQLEKLLKLTGHRVARVCQDEEGGSAKVFIKELKQSCEKFADGGIIIVDKFNTLSNRQQVYGVGQNYGAVYYTVELLHPLDEKGEYVHQIETGLHRILSRGDKHPSLRPSEVLGEIELREILTNFTQMWVPVDPEAEPVSENWTLSILDVPRANLEKILGYLSTTGVVNCQPSEAFYQRARDMLTSHETTMATRKVVVKKKTSNAQTGYWAIVIDDSTDLKGRVIPAEMTRVKDYHVTLAYPVNKSSAGDLHNYWNLLAGQRVKLEYDCVVFNDLAQAIPVRIVEPTDFLDTHGDKISNENLHMTLAYLNRPADSNIMLIDPARRVKQFDAKIVLEGVIKKMY